MALLDDLNAEFTEVEHALAERFSVCASVAFEDGKYLIFATYRGDQRLCLGNTPDDVALKPLAWVPRQYRIAAVTLLPQLFYALGAMQQGEDVRVRAAITQMREFRDALATGKVIAA